jgi:hypothetical protein
VKENKIWYTTTGIKYKGFSGMGKFRNIFSLGVTGYICGFVSDTFHTRKLYGTTIKKLARHE